MARDVGAHFIDLTGIYAGIPEQVYTDYCHLTPAGNTLLARYVEQRMFRLILHDDAILLENEIDNFVLHEQPKIRKSFCVPGEEIEKIALRHEGDELAARR